MWVPVYSISVSIYPPPSFCACSGSMVVVPFLLGSLCLSGGPLQVISVVSFAVADDGAGHPVSDCGNCTGLSSWSNPNWFCREISIAKANVKNPQSTPALLGVLC